MILARVKFLNSDILELEVSGHANAGKYGEDLICAAVTAIVSGALNGLDQLQKNNVELEVLENKITITVLKSSQELQLLFQFLLIQLQTINVQYPKKFKIEEVL